jgi:hypothetical protein
MKTFLLKLSAITVGIFLQSQYTAAAVNIEASTGVEQDSNLNIVELDQQSQDSDLAALLGLKLDAKGKLFDKLSLSGGYSYNSKNYRTNKNFNLAIHQVNADANYNLDVMTIGLSHHYADAILDKDSFLVLNQTSFYASKLINDFLYLRAATNFQDKSFNAAKERNAHNLGFSSDAFIFFNHGKTFVAVSLGKDKEDARTNSLDYKTNQYSAKASHKFMLRKKEQKIQLGWRHIERNYSGITEEINAERYDTSQIIDINWEISLTQSISIETKIENGKYDSNFASANYAENRASVKLKAYF